MKLVNGLALPAEERDSVVPTSTERVAAARQRIERILSAAREHLGMDVAYISRIQDGTQTFSYVHGDAASFGWQAGQSMPAEDGFCQRVLSGDLPAIIPDVADEPVAANLPVRIAANIGSYVGVPLLLENNRVYGALCCTAHGTREGLTEADGAFMRVLADLIAVEIGEVEREELTQRMHVDAVSRFLEPDAIEIALQPIVDLADGRVVGAEALARFGAGTNPADVFAAAASMGLGVPLELAAIKAAVALLPQLPPSVYLSVNISPETVARNDLTGILDSAPAHRLVLELTEGVPVNNYPQVVRHLAPGRAAGMRVAVGDKGSGYASLQHILALKPDIIKLDLTLVRGIDRDPARRALAGALTGFVKEFGAGLVAEGIETPGELETLRRLNVLVGQGYHLGRPGPLALLKPDVARYVGPTQVRTDPSERLVSRFAPAVAAAS